MGRPPGFDFLAKPVGQTAHGSDVQPPVGQFDIGQRRLGCLETFQRIDHAGNEQSIFDGI